MSGLETAAAPILIPLIKSDAKSLSIAERVIITRWIVMKAMVLDHLNADQVAIPLDAKRDFYLRREIPAGTRIALAMCREVETQAMFYWTTTLLEGPQIPRDDIYTKNAQVIMFGIGNLVVHFLATTVSSFTPDFATNPYVIVTLWPLTKTDINWPLPRPLTESDFISLARAFTDLLVRLQLLNTPQRT